MDNELLEICKRLECDSIVDPKGKWIVTRAERLTDGNWELIVEKQEEPKEAADDNN